MHKCATLELTEGFEPTQDCLQNRDPTFRRRQHILSPTLPNRTESARLPRECTPITLAQGLLESWSRWESNPQSRSRRFLRPLRTPFPPRDRQLSPAGIRTPISGLRAWCSPVELWLTYQPGIGYSQSGRPDSNRCVWSGAPVPVTSRPRPHDQRFTSGPVGLAPTA